MFALFVQYSCKITTDVKMAFFFFFFLSALLRDNKRYICPLRAPILSCHLPLLRHCWSGQVRTMSQVFRSHTQGGIPLARALLSSSSRARSGAGTPTHSRFFQVRAAPSQDLSTVNGDNLPISSTPGSAESPGM